MFTLAADCNIQLKSMNEFAFCFLLHLPTKNHYYYWRQNPFSLDLISLMAAFSNFSVQSFVFVCYPDKLQTSVTRFNNHNNILF